MLATLIWLFCSLTPAWAGEVTMPLDEWANMLDRLEQADDAQPAPTQVLHLSRTLEGSLDRGVFTGVLTTRFALPETNGPVRVPILDARTTIDEVWLDRSPTSLLPENGEYTVGVQGAGEHELVVRFFQGREDDRFARRLRFDLPDGGPTRADIQVPEQNIEAKLGHGALVSTRRTRSGSTLTGYLDGTGTVDLTWSSARGASATARTEAELHTLLTLHDALVRGVADLQVNVLEGEVDMIDLRLPEELEVVDVTGDAVLQWQTRAAEDGPKLQVLLRYLVDDQAQLRIHFQFPTDLDAPVPLRTPLPLDGVPTKGSLGVQGPAGLAVDVARLEGATQLNLRDLPTRLTELTGTPLLTGFSFTETPDVALAVQRGQAIELTSTIVDDVQASTVLLGEGTEITRVRMRVRNNASQFLQARLPEGAVLTHALIDGQPVRPATSGPTDPAGPALLLPLRQSERIDAGAAHAHLVQPGDTLGHIATLYWSDPTRWNELVYANPDQLGSAWDLAPGQTLRVPAASATVQESSFVIELAYKRMDAALGAAGTRSLRLPALDVDTVALTWHLYMPESHEALAFSGNVQQYSNLRYDPVRRVRQFLRRTLLTRDAWAGGYENILSRRKSIYRAEAARGASGEGVLAEFPYVGNKIRFKRILPGRDQPELAVRYVHANALPPTRHLALLAAVILSAILTSRGPTRARMLTLIGFGLLLVVGHYVLGVHRRLVWGLDLALAWRLIQERRPIKARLPFSPFSVADQISVRRLLALAAGAVGLHILLSLPLLLSTATLAGLLLAHRVRR